MKKTYEKPMLEVIFLASDVIVTSDCSGAYMPCDD